MIETRDVCLFQLFARYPEAGRVKTRLAAAIGDDAALAVHEELLERTAKSLVNARLGRVELWLDRAGAHPLLEELWRRGVAGPRLQVGIDLGARMHAAIAAGLARTQRVVLVGSDCPDLDATYLARAVAALESADVVFGPAEDGGYVLIGCRRLSPALFQAIPWGTSAVLERSLAAAESAAFEVALLPPRYDVDSADDLARWRRA